MSCDRKPYNDTVDMRKYNFIKDDATYMWVSIETLDDFLGMGKCEFMKDVDNV